MLTTPTPMSQTFHRRRLLMVSHVFPPMVGGGAPRMGQFARYLPEHGWDVVVATGRHSEAAAVDRAALDSLPKAVDVVRTWSPQLSRRGGPNTQIGARGAIRAGLRAASRAVLFPDRQMFWVPGAIRAALQQHAKQPFDAIMASYAPGSNLIVGRAVAARTGLPLLVDFRDLWSDLPLPTFASTAHRRMAAALERQLVAGAARLTAVSPRMTEHLARVHGVADSCAVSITNGFDPATVGAVHDDRSRANRPFRLVYTGSAHVLYSFEPFWKLLLALRDEGVISSDNFRAVFIGSLSARDVEAMGLSDLVETRPFVSHARVFDMFADADALLLVESPGYYRDFSYAAKVFDYVLTGKPVLALVEDGSYSGNLLSAAGVGFCADPSDAAGVRAQFVEVLGKKNAPPRPVDIAAEPFRDFDRRRLTERLANVLHDMVDQAAR